MANENVKDLDQEMADDKQRKTNVINAILPTLDLPKEEDPDIELTKMRNDDLREIRRKQKVGQENVQKKDGKSETDKEVDAEIEAGTVEEDEPTEDEKKKEGDEETEEKEDELIPKSKVDKRFKALTAKIKALESQATRAATQPVTNIDSDRAKLETMSQSELKQALRNTKVKIRGFMAQLATSDDEAEKRKVDNNLADHDELEEKIHDALATYPQRFYASQVNELQGTIDGISYDEDIEDPEEALVEIKKLAEGIYQQHPQMQTLKTGMKTAYELAIAHYKILQASDVGKSEQKRVKRENVRLKRKTTLDSSKVKGQAATRSSRKLELLRKKLAGKDATDDDRADFIKENPLFNVDKLIDAVPEEYR